MYNTGFKKWDRNDVVSPRHCVSSHMASTGKYIEIGITGVNCLMLTVNTGKQLEVIPISRFGRSQFSERFIDYSAYHVGNAFYVQSVIYHVSV